MAGLFRSLVSKFSDAGSAKPTAATPEPITAATRFTLAYLQVLVTQLAACLHGTGGGASDEALIDIVKQISELMVYGDKHNDKFFEFFGVRGVMKMFLDLFHSRSSAVRVQIIQTVSIMLMNITNQRSLFFLLSNNHVNELIASGGNGEHGVFDRFGEEEVLAYWISFLKTLSLSANANTVQFFLTYAPDGRDVGFPLYTQAIKYFTHPDSMVRTSVRTITLNVYQIRDPLVRNMLLTNESDFPRKVARQLADMVRNMSTRLEHVSTTAREGAARLSPTSIRHAFARRAAAEGHTAGIISGRDGRSCSGSSSVYAATSSVADRSMSESCGTSLGTGPRWVPVEGMDSLNWQLPTCNEVYAVHSLLQRRANSVCSAKKEAANEGVDAASSGGSHTGARSFSAPHSHSSSDDNLSVAVEAPVVESDAAHRDQTAIFATIERQLADMSDIMSDVYDSIMYVQDIFAIQEREAAEAPTPVAARSARKVKRPQPELDVSFAPFCDALVDALMNELVEPLLLRSLRYTAMCASYLWMTSDARLASSDAHAPATTTAPAFNAEAAAAELNSAGEQLLCDPALALRMLASMCKTWTYKPITRRLVSVLLEAPLPPLCAAGVSHAFSLVRSTTAAADGTEARGVPDAVGVHSDHVTTLRELLLMLLCSPDQRLAQAAANLLYVWTSSARISDVCSPQLARAGMLPYYLEVSSRAPSNSNYGSPVPASTPTEVVSMDARLSAPATEPQHLLSEVLHAGPVTAVTSTGLFCAAPSVDCQSAARLEEAADSAAAPCAPDITSAHGTQNVEKSAAAARHTDADTVPATALPSQVCEVSDSDATPTACVIDASGPHAASTLVASTPRGELEAVSSARSASASTLRDSTDRTLSTASVVPAPLFVTPACAASRRREVVSFILRGLLRIPVPRSSFCHTLLAALCRLSLLPLEMSAAHTTVDTLSSLHDEGTQSPLPPAAATAAEESADTPLVDIGAEGRALVEGAVTSLASFVQHIVADAASSDAANQLSSVLNLVEHFAEYEVRDSLVTPEIVCAAHGFSSRAPDLVTPLAFASASDSGAASTPSHTGSRSLSALPPAERRQRILEALHKRSNAALSRLLNASHAAKYTSEDDVSTLVPVPAIPYCALAASVPELSAIGFEASGLDSIQCVSTVQQMSLGARLLMVRPQLKPADIPSLLTDSALLVHAAVQLLFMMRALRGCWDAYPTFRVLLNAAASPDACCVLVQQDEESAPGVVDGVEPAVESAHQLWNGDVLIPDAVGAQLAPPFDSIRPGNLCPLSKLDWRPGVHKLETLSSIKPPVGFNLPTPPRLRMVSATTAPRAIQYDVRPAVQSRQVATVLGQSYLVLAEVLPPRSGGSAVATRGRALSVCPLHFCFPTPAADDASSSVVDIRVVSREELPLTVCLPASAEGAGVYTAVPHSDVQVRIYGFTLTLEDAATRDAVIHHIHEARERIVASKLSVISCLGG